MTYRFSAGTGRSMGHITKQAAAIVAVAALGFGIQTALAQNSPIINGVDITQNPVGSVLNPVYGIHDSAGLQANPPDANVPCIVPPAWLKTPQEMGWMHDDGSLAGSVPFNKIDDRLEVSNNSVHTIFVNFREPVTDANGVMKQSLRPTFSAIGTVGFVSSVIPTIGMIDVSYANIQALAARSDVAFVEQQQQYFATNLVSCQTTKVRGPFYSPNTVLEKFPTIFGTGITIAIMDTGCDDPGGPGTRHNSLPIAVNSYDGIAGSFTNPDDKQGHGTHVAGIALGRGTTTGTPLTPRGVAAGDPGVDGGLQQGASLIDVKVLGDDGGSQGFSIEASINVLIQRKIAWNVKVVNMSIGNNGSSDGLDAQSQLVDRASQAGIVMVAAASNEGPFNVGLCNPGAASTAITVGSVDNRDSATRADDIISIFSRRGPRGDNHDGNCFNELKPEIVAPGAVDATGALPNAAGILSAKFDSQNDGVREQGTSMASPHVAGICALMLQANPALSPQQVKDALINSAEKIQSAPGSAPGCDGRWNKDYGYGLVDALGALSLIANPNPLPEPHKCVTALNLVTPRGNETLVKGTTRQVTWNFDGNTNDSIDLLLYSGDTYLGSVAKNVPVKNQVYNWVIGSALDNNAPQPQGATYGLTIRPSFSCTPPPGPMSSTPAFFTILDSVVAAAAPPGAAIPTGQTIPVIEVAPGESVVLGAVAADGTTPMTGTKGKPPYTYQWSPADYLNDSSLARPTATPARSLTYQVNVRDSTGFIASDKVTVLIGNPLRVDAGPNKVFRIGSAVLLEGFATGGSPPYSYEWSPVPDPTQPIGLNGVTIAQPSAKPSQATVFTLKVTDGIGTVRSDTMNALPGLQLTIVNNPGNAGTVNRSISKELYTGGETIQLQAVPNAGWLFDHWESPPVEFDHRDALGNDLTENPTPFTFRTADVKIEAVYRQITPSNTGTTSALPMIGCAPLMPTAMLAMLFGVALMRRTIRRSRR